MTTAQAAIHFIVLSRSSQAPFPCDVAEKCHSAENADIFFVVAKIEKVFFVCPIKQLCLYLDAAPSEKYIIFRLWSFSKKKIWIN